LSHIAAKQMTLDGEPDATFLDPEEYLAHEKAKLAADRAKLAIDREKHERKKAARAKEKGINVAFGGVKPAPEPFKILPVSFHSATIQEVTVSFAEYEDPSLNMAMRHTFTGEKEFSCMVLLQQFVSTYNEKHPKTPMELDQVAIYVNGCDVTDEPLASVIAGYQESQDPAAVFAKVNSFLQVKMKNSPPTPQRPVSRECGIAGGIPTVIENMQPLKLTMEYTAHEDSAQNLATLHSVAPHGQQEPVRTLLHDFVSVYNSNKPSNQLDVDKLALYYNDRNVIDLPFIELYLTSLGVNDFSLQPNLSVRHKINCILVTDDERLKIYGSEYMFHVTEPWRTFKFGQQGKATGTMRMQLVKGKMYDVVEYHFVKRANITHEMVEQAALNTDELLDHLRKAAKAPAFSVDCCAVRR